MKKLDRDKVNRRIALGLAILMLLSVIVTVLISLTGCSSATSIKEGDDVGPLVMQYISEANSQYEEEQAKIKETEEYKESVLEALKKEGIADDTITTDNIETTETGLSVLGGNAKTLTSFKSLAQAEEKFGFYLGLHNKLNDGKQEWSLVSVYSIGDTIMYGRYESGAETKDGSAELFTIKASKEEKANSLVSTYLLNSTEYIGIEGIECQLGKSEDGKYIAGYFDTKNGKSYSIYNGNGFEKESLVAIMTELMHNLMGMDDWT